MSRFAPARAQQHFNFDPIAIAKLRAGEIAREIEGSVRDTSIPEPSRDSVFNTGLLSQAGLRALLPAQERQGVALPGTPSPKDPPELVQAQENYKAVFELAENTAANALTPADTGQLTALFKFWSERLNSLNSDEGNGLSSGSMVAASEKIVKPGGLQ